MRLLIVGSLDGHITAAGKIALSRGAKVAHVDDVDQAMHALRNGQGADLIMFDVALDTQRMIESLRNERINIPVVACGIGTSAETAVKAIKAGAKEYVPLPPDAELIAAVLAAVAEESSALIYRDPAMKAVLKLADQVAPSDASIMITGESGTGKEVMARYIHAHSKRANKPFISVNCAAIPENLLESELFGHEKGSFTGAIARRIGKFEEANGGTLLLDEISEMHPRLQAKLLRAIQERVIDRVGGTTPVKVDIRLLATSNRDLQEEVRKGNFRDDLFFRLNVMALELPALRAPAGRHPGPGRAFHQEIRRGQRHPHHRHRAGSHGHAARPRMARQRARAGEHHASRRPAGAGFGDRPGGHHADRRARHPGLGAAAASRGGRRSGQCQGRRGQRRHQRAGRPHGRRGRARPHHRHAAALPRQPDPCREHPRHLDPHPAQQAQAV